MAAVSLRSATNGRARRGTGRAPWCAWHLRVTEALHEGLLRFTGRKQGKDMTDRVW